MDINTVPIPDWDLFEQGSLYRPMQGKVYRTVKVRRREAVLILVLFVILLGIM